MKKSLYGGRAIRTIVWDVLFYASCLFAAFYLKDKTDIVNWDVAVCFLPYVFYAGSTETLSTQCRQTFKPFAAIDLVVKTPNLLFSYLMHRNAVGAYFWVFFGAICACAATCVVCAVFMIRRARRELCS